MLKRFIAVLVILSLVFTVFAAGCSKTATPDTSNQTASKQETTTAAREPGIVKIFAPDNAPPGSPDPSESKVTKAIEKALNIKMEFDLQTTSNYEEMLNVRLASGTALPDIFMTASLQAEDLANSNTVVALNKYFDTILPNVAKEVARDDVLRPQVTSPDGNIYFLPTRLTSRGNLKTWNIRKDWMDELGLSIPKTPDEFYNVLKAFKKRDPKSIPYLERYYAYAWFYTMYFFGLNVYQPWDWCGFDNKTKEFYIFLLKPEFKETMQFVARLYKEGLINQDILSITPEIYDNYLYSDKAGCVFSSYVYLDVDKIKAQNPGSKAEYIGILPPVVPGREMGVRSYTVLQNRYFVSEKGDNKEDALKLIDYIFADPEGAKLWNLGIEGETYTVENGEYKWTDFVLKNPNKLTAVQTLSAYGASWRNYLPLTHVLPGVGYPSYIDANHWGTKAMELYEKAGFLRPELQLRMTAQEAEKRTAIGNKVNDFANEYLTGVMTGSKSFDTWDDFIKQLKEMGIEELATIFQNAYDRAF